MTSAEVHREIRAYIDRQDMESRRAMPFAVPANDTAPAPKQTPEQQRAYCMAAVAQAKNAMAKTGD